MPTVILNKKVFEKFVGKKLPLAKLKDRISMLGTDLEKIEGNKIHVEVFPDRPDMLSEQGFARAFSSFIGVKKGLRKYNVKKSGEKVIVDKSVKGIRPHTACAIVKNMKFDDEKIKGLVQIQEKLHITYGRNRKKVAIGIYPYEKITPPIKFVAKRPNDIKFRPLECNKEMNGLQILSQISAGREYGHLLEGKDKFPVFIDSNNNILSMPPIINSHDTGKITEKTKNVFIECSGFDFDMLSKCLNIIVTAMAEMGGEVYSMTLDYGGKMVQSPDLSPKEMKVDAKYVNKILGLNLKEKQIKNLLERMGYNYNKGMALIPGYRADILHQIDLIEDIAIAYGYENFKEEIPKVATIAEENPFEVFRSRIANILVGLGLVELNTYHLIEKDIQTKGCNSSFEVVEIIDPVSREYNSLRKWMIPSLLNVLKHNKHNEYPQDIFEMGTIFRASNKTESGVAEAVRLCVMLCNPKADFTGIKQILDYLFRMMGVEYGVVDVECSSFLPGRVGRVIVNEKKVAYIGEMSPQVLENFEIEMPVAALELNLSDLFEVIQR